MPGAPQEPSFLPRSSDRSKGIFGLCCFDEWLLLFDCEGAVKDLRLIQVDKPFGGAGRFLVSHARSTPLDSGGRA